MSEPIRVSLDVSAIPLRAAGAGQYALGLAGALDRRDDVTVTLLARHDDTSRWQQTAPRSAVVGWAPGPRPLRLVWEQTGLPVRLRTLAVDLHHGVHYTMPAHTRLPVVVTVHDLTYFDHPEWHEPAKVRFFRRAIRVASQRAGAIVAVSEPTARRLRELCAPRAPVVVAPHGIDFERFGPTDPTGDDASRLARVGVEPGRPLVVFVGTLEPRKGVATLVEAFDRVADRYSEAALVLAGQPGWGDVDPRSVSSHPDRLVVTGYVPDEAVPALYRNATAVAYPSLGEGVGMPAFEAVACGAPLVTTDGTPMAEALGDAALLVPPNDVPSLAEALGTLLGGDPGRDARRAAGLARVAELTWESSATAHLEAYRLAAVR